MSGGHRVKTFTSSSDRLARQTRRRRRRHWFGRIPPFNGDVTIGPHSSLRKLMRAAARGLVPPERAQVIGQAMANADRRYDVYENQHRETDA